MRRQQNQLTVFETSRAGLVKVKALMFFASILLQTPFVEDPTCPTAWTDMTQIGYNPEFIEGLDIPTAKFVIIHEIMHIILKHGLRRDSRDPAEWNRCCDFAINILLKDLGFKVWPYALIDERYRGMTAEQIYLNRQHPSTPFGKCSGAQERDPSTSAQGKGQGEKSKSSASAQTPGQGSGQPQASTSAQPGPFDKCSGEEQGGLSGDLKPVPASTPEKRAAIEHSIDKTLARASTIAREHGVMPAGLEAVIKATYEDPVPWEQVLIDYMSACIAEEENWNVRNRRHPGIILPSYKSDGMDEFVIIADSSGSMFSKKIFERIAVAVNHIVTVIKPMTVRVVWADDKDCQNIDVFEDGAEVTLHPKGGGGTDMCKPLKYVEQYSPEVVLLLTDGYTPYPEIPTPYPLIIGCTTGTPCPDWAGVVRIEVP